MRVWEGLMGSNDCLVCPGLWATLVAVVMALLVEHRWVD